MQHVVEQLATVVWDILGAADTKFTAYQEKRRKERRSLELAQPGAAWVPISSEGVRVSSAPQMSRQRS